MIFRNLSWIFLAMALASGCAEQEELVSAQAELLVNDKGWVCYAYSRHEIGSEGELVSEQPYIILGEYGSGLIFGHDSLCYIQYTDGITAVQRNSIVKTWEVLDNKFIEFSDSTSQKILARILLLSEDSLHIEYEEWGDRWEYRLERIP